jgi:hypothetical protein
MCSTLYNVSQIANGFYHSSSYSLYIFFLSFDSGLLLIIQYYILLGMKFQEAIYNFNYRTMTQRTLTRQHGKVRLFTVSSCVASDFQKGRAHGGRKRQSYYRWPLQR